MRSLRCAGIAAMLAVAVLAVAVLAARPPEAQAETLVVRRADSLSTQVLPDLSYAKLVLPAYAFVARDSITAAHRASATAQSVIDRDVGLLTSATSPAPYSKRRPPSTSYRNDTTLIVNPARFSASAVGIRLLTR